MAPIKIFVGNIAVGTSNQELSDLFAQYGQVTECDILGAGNYAFVHMGSESEGELAIKELSSCVLNGSELNIEKSTSATQGRRRKELTPGYGDGPRQGGGGGRGGGERGSHRGIPRRSTTKIFVGNIKDGTTNAELQAIFEPHGTVVEADVVGGFGFVHMESQGEAIKAIKALNGSQLNGNRINIELSTEATQGRSRESMDEAGGGFPEEFLPRGRALARGGGHPLAAGRRYNPYDKALGGVPSYRRGLYPAADPYAASAYASAYRAMDYASDPYALALAAPVLARRAPLAAPAAAAASGTSDTFARQLLNLYIKDPSSFDKFAKNPLIQQSLELDSAQDEEDPYYRPPKEYYEAKSATSTSSSFRGSGLDDAYGGGDGYAAIPRRSQPLLSVGSSRGLVGAGLPAPRSLGFIGGGPLMGHRSLGAPGLRPRLPPPRQANLYTSFE